MQKIDPTLIISPVYQNSFIHEQVLIILITRLGDNTETIVMTIKSKANNSERLIDIK